MAGPTVIAILPFSNASGDPNTEYLSDGITEGIIDRLAGHPNVKVMSRTSAFRYRRRDIDPQKVAKELGVEALVTGRYQRVASAALGTGHTGPRFLPTSGHAHDGNRLRGKGPSQKTFDAV